MSQKKFLSLRPIWLIILTAFLGGIAGAVLVAGSPRVQQGLGLKTNNGGKAVNKPVKQKIVLEESSAITDVAEKVAPAVVSITSKRDVIGLFGQVYSASGGGTGFIITADGQIVTNKHVVEDESAQYTVFLANGKDYEAKVIARDPFQDLAVLKIEANSLPVVEFGDSDALKVGQWVVAIGNALGEFDNTVTAGVISAKERQIVAGGSPSGLTEQLSGLLQTDAAINQGNSGGPLVNLAGQVIGVNTAVASKSSAEGIGFAIPINAVLKSIEQVKKTGKISRPYLGVRYVPVTKEIARMNHLSQTSGALVISGNKPNQLAVLPGSPASSAGIKEGDIITKVDNTSLNEDNSLQKVLSHYLVGDKVKLTIYRGNKKLEVDVVLEELKT